MLRTPPRIVLSFFLLSAFLLAPTAAQTLEIGPIPGLTTTWHTAPDATAVPVGTTLRLRVAAPDGSTVVWSGAVETSHGGGWSEAECPVGAAGSERVRVDIVRPDGMRQTRTCTLEGIAIRPEDIEVRDIRVTVDPVPLHVRDLNASTYSAFRGGSIAALRRLGPDRYRTSVGRRLHLEAEVEPAGFAPLMEWRSPHHGFLASAKVGGTLSISLNQPGLYPIWVGPPASAQRIYLETYSVEITSHTSWVDRVPEGIPITFTARTVPAGLEDEITWLSSTSFGSASPISGRGQTFTATFRNTFGSHPLTAEPFQWLGVRADNATFNQDTKGEVLATEFSQVDLNLGGNTQFNSTWGSLDVTFIGTAALRYVNLVVDGVWTIINVPILDVEGAGIPQTVTLNFGLGNAPGEDVTEIDCAFGFTPDVLETPPQGTVSVPVGNRAVDIDQGELEQEGEITEGQVLVGGPAVVLNSAFNHLVPNQEVDHNECVPGALSNSLLFLQQRHGLTYPQGVGIDEMKIATEWTEAGAPLTPTPWWDLKDNFMQANGFPITTTTTTSFAEAAQALRDDCDVEIRVPGHAAVVTAIIPLMTGDIGIMVKHDTLQGQPGGLKTELLLYQGATGTLWDGMWFDGKPFDRFVIECPTL